MNGESDKANLRAEMARRKQATAPAAFARDSRAAQERFLTLPAWARARTVALYLALPGEVGCDFVLAAARATGRRVCVPAWREEQQRYGMTVLRADDRMGAGPWRTREPQRKEWTPLEEADLIAVPGVAFDRRGRRLGRGGGHYDRLLAGLPPADAGGPLKVGLLFAFQMAESLPVMKWDIAMDWLVSENEICNCEEQTERRNNG
jgi:5-formyltetrahydrofolate cyclo-ligase